MAEKYELWVPLPKDLPPGEYQVWVHAGRGGKFGWGGPIPWRTANPPSEEPRTVEFKGGNLQEAVDRLSREGGGVLQLPEGVIQLHGTLVVPAKVAVKGAAGGGLFFRGEKSVLQTPDDPAAHWAPISGAVRDRGPAGDRAAVLLAGDSAGLVGVVVCGSPQTNIGIAARSPEYPRWIRGCIIEDVIIRDVGGKQPENCGIRLYHADDAFIARNENLGRAPIFLSGVRDSQITGNHLVSVTRWGGNSEGYILGATRRSDGASSRTTRLPRRAEREPAGRPAGA